MCGPGGHKDIPGIQPKLQPFHWPGARDETRVSNCTVSCQHKWSQIAGAEGCVGHCCHKHECYCFVHTGVPSSCQRLSTPSGAASEKRTQQNPVVSTGMVLPVDPKFPNNAKPAKTIPQCKWWNIVHWHVPGKLATRCVAHPKSQIAMECMTGKSKAMHKLWHWQSKGSLGCPMSIWRAVSAGSLDHRAPAPGWWSGLGFDPLLRFALALALALAMSLARELEGALQIERQRALLEAVLLQIASDQEPNG